ncbi:hypothetical protein RFI_31099 [Reticulomyxa filosa]|uniref:Transmembrane protein n=1 Tax=Reticulomyxa filosa TaxID=46433 RepID=X6LYR1_RETFI|nr:hypothetical protein RFI_31099 [Reticulomyxa filosa]|eukprot:ETO06297.1 hypothetical protein RFI_31099 [Reticulomyxa filosa]
MEVTLIKYFLIYQKELFYYLMIIYYHCFILRTKNVLTTMKKSVKKKIEMLLFCYETILSITYDENYNTFQSHKYYIPFKIIQFNYYAYIHINYIILFFWLMLQIKMFQQNDAITATYIYNRHARKREKETDTKKHCIIIKEADLKKIKESEADMYKLVIVKFLANGRMFTLSTSAQVIRMNSIFSTCRHKHDILQTAKLSPDNHFVTG